MTKLERFLCACRGGKPDRPPVWLMRQAGRYLPEYRKLREKFSFEEIISSPELSSIVSIQPLRRFGLDAVIVMSDILIVPKVMGIKVSYLDSGVLLEPALNGSGDLKKLKLKSLHKGFSPVAGAITNIRKEVGKNVPIIGFAGAPFTLACFMIEGEGGERDLRKTRQVMFSKESFFIELLKRIEEIVVVLLEEQIQASANAIMLFDSLTEILGEEEFKKFALPSIKNIFKSLDKNGVPRIYYARGSGIPLNLLKDCGVDVFSADWRISLSNARKILGNGVSLQGNIDPACLFAGEEKIKSEVRRVISQTGGVGHIVNLGAGIFPETPLKGVETLVKEIKRGMVQNVGANGRSPLQKY